MAEPLDGERGKGSTRWVPAGERITPSARGKTPQRQRRYRWIGLPLQRRSQKITLTVTYKGGPECWYLVEARGRHGVFPGVAYLHDVLDEVKQLR